MTLCTYDSSIMATCPDLQTELIMFVGLLGQVDQLKIGSGDHEPTWVELAALWEGCLVPPAAMVFWYNSSTSIITWWFNPTGDYDEKLA